MVGRCAKNRELLKCVVEKLTEIEELTRAQRAARTNGDQDLARELDKKLDLAFGEKERSVGAWQEHQREHGC